MTGLIDLYVYSLTEDEIKFLLFKRAKGKIYQSQWRMIGGKREANETYWQTALREMREETGLTPEDFWTVPSLNHFYEHKTDQIHMIPAFAARISADAHILLNDEHSEYCWMHPEQAVQSTNWPEQRRLMNLIEQIACREGILPEWRIKF